MSYTSGRVSPQAWDDFFDIHDYIAADNATVGSRYRLVAKPLALRVGMYDLASRCATFSGRGHIIGLFAPSLTMSIIKRHNINIVGNGNKTMVLAHGYGCDQIMWRFLTPEFENDYRIVLFDHVGAGKSDLSAYRRQKYESLDGYADDILEIIAETSDSPVIFVGHSVSSMIGVLAAIKRPSAFERLILVGPSPCYINDGDYVGGFTRSDIDGLLQTLADNHLGWSKAMAPVIMKNAERPELAAELEESFCRTDPEIARHFARATFLSDNRADLASLTVPSLVLQCSDDSIAPDEVGEFVHRHLTVSTLVKMKAVGHCPHLSAPAETIQLIKEYLSAL